jgi:hypothetical protein
MTIKKRGTVRTLEQGEAGDIDYNLAELFKSKLQSTAFRDHSASESTLKTFQHVEHGTFSISASGAGVEVAVSVPLHETRGTIIFAHASIHGTSSHSALFNVAVTQITATQISFGIRPLAGTTFSNISTQSFTGYYQVWSSQP